LLERVVRASGPQPQYYGASDAGKAGFQTKHLTESELGQTSAPLIVQEALRSSGEPLNPRVRDFMGSRFGHDFSLVRVHVGGEAADAAAAVRARAYTIGRDIFFGAGEYAPASREGQRLLAHELTHVMQQQAPGAPPVLSRSPDDKKVKEHEVKTESKEAKKDDKPTKKEEVDEKEREKLLTEFTAGAGLSSDHLDQIRAAMRAFFPASAAGHADCESRRETAFHRSSMAGQSSAISKSLLSIPIFCVSSGYPTERQPMPSDTSWLIPGIMHGRENLSQFHS
jgi:uncharacterized protein DUF4157